MKTTYKISPPKIITFPSNKYFNNESFREAFLQIKCNGKNCNENFEDFTSTCNAIQNGVQPPRKKSM